MSLTLLMGNWWAFVLRGAAAILFGVLTFLMPGMALLTLVLLFGAYALVEGVFNVVGAVRRTGSEQRPWWLLLLEGLVSVVAGLLTFLVPGVTALALLFIIAGWAVLTGCLEIATAIRLRKQVKGEWLLALSGVLSIAFGVLAGLFPGAGALSVLFWIAAYSVVFGAMLVALGLKLRRRTRTGEQVGVGRLATSH